MIITNLCESLKRFIQVSHRGAFAIRAIKGNFLVGFAAGPASGDISLRSKTAKGTFASYIHDSRLRLWMVTRRCDEYLLKIDVLLDYFSPSTQFSTFLA